MHSKLPPLLAWNILLNDRPLEVTAQRCAINTWYRLCSDLKPGPKYGHSDILVKHYQLLHPIVSNPQISSIKKLNFVDESITFYFPPSKTGWIMISAPINLRSVHTQMAH